MEAELLKEEDIHHLLAATGELLKLSRSRMWLDYDAEADCLYLHFTEAPASSHSEMREDGILLDYDDEDRLVGLTILEASSR